MTVDKARAALARVLSRIELRRWPWKITPHATIGGSEVLFVTEEVPDRDSGQLTNLGGMQYGLPPSLEDEALIGWVYVQLQRHVLHELAESFHVDGVRVCDPHTSVTAEQLDALMSESPSFEEYAGKFEPETGEKGGFLTVEQIEELAKR